MDNEQKSTLDVVADIAEFANAVASLLVGHRNILVEGGFNPILADNMCYGLHAKLLGLAPEWEPDDEDGMIIHVLHEEDDDDELD